MFDPLSLVMLAMIGLLIIFMVRNGKKRREMMEKLQTGIKPGAQVMLQSGIFGVVEDIDEEDGNKVTLRSGTSTIIVHRNAIGNIVEPQEPETFDELTPDDDPAFGENPESEDSQDSK